MGLSKAFYEEQQPELTDEDLDYMRHLLEQSTFDQRQRKYILGQINTETDVEELERIREELWKNNLGIHSAVNPSQKELNYHLKKTIK